MTFFKVFVGVLGSFLISLGISIIFGVIFLSHIAAQEASLDNLLDETFTRMFVEDSETVRAALQEEPTFATFFKGCDDGSLSEKECVLDQQNPYLSSYISSAKEGLKMQIIPLFGYLDQYMTKRVLLSSLAIVSFILGCFFLFFSVEYNKFIFSRKLLGKLGLYFLFAFLFVFFILHVSKEQLVSIFQNFIAGAPDILYSFVAYLALGFISTLFQAFYYPLFILTILFILLWIGFWVYYLTVGKNKVKNQASL